MLNILALSSSGSVASAALLSGGSVLREIVCELGRTHSETLVPAVEQILRESGAEIFDMGAFAVDVGPGSFTGVRIGVCFANALAAAAKKPVVGIDSLTAHYKSLAGFRGEAAVLLDARGQRCYCAKFLDNKIIEPPRAADLEECLRTAGPGTVFTGDGAFAYRGLIEKKVSFAKFVKTELRASQIAFEAYDRFQKGETASAVFPLYLRSSQAERVFNERHG